MEFLDRFRFVLDNQLIIMTKELIPSGTRLYSNRIIKDIQIKEEPIEANISRRIFPRIFFD